MIRKVLSKLPDSKAVGRCMNYDLKDAALIGGSEVKFDNTSIEDYNKLGVKKFDQVNKKFEGSTGRKQEVVAIHEVISFSAKDDVTNEQALEIALGIWKEALDLDHRKYRVAVHDKSDNGKTHVHLVWNMRNNKGEIHNKKDDYLLFEKLCHEAELKHGFEEVKNRKYLKPDMPTNPQSSNEWRYERKGKKSEKTLFKEAVAAATDKAMTAGEFLEFLDRDGYTLILNGSQGYSLEKEGRIFKASEVGASYKLLKARFGDDPEFTATLARLGVKKAPEREMGGISFDMYVTQADLDKYEAKKKKSNRVLDTRFDSPDGHDFFFKDTNKKAFEYDAMRGRVDFNNNSPTAVKAGLQKLTENVKKPTSFKLGGSDYAKREIWLQFHLMGLDKKGHTLTGYSPTLADKAKLEQEQNKFSVKISEPAENVTQKNDENVTQKNEHNAESSASEKRQLIDSSWKLENFTKFNIEDVKSKKEEKTRAEKAAESGAAGVLAGFVKALCSLENSYTYNKIDDHLQPLRVIDKEHKDKSDEAESEYHKNKRRKRNKPRPQ